MLRRLPWPGLCLIATLALGWMLRGLVPPPVGLPPPPSERAWTLLLAGEPRLAFRLASLALQHAGSIEAVVTPVADLPAERVAAWLGLMDAVTRTPDSAPMIAAHLWGPAASPPAIRAIVAFLQSHAAADPADKWRWLMAALYLARWKLEDLPLARDVAHRLQAVPGPLPPLARNPEALILLDMGEAEAARALLLEQLDGNPNLPADERQWIEETLVRRFKPQAAP